MLPGTYFSRKEFACKCGCGFDVVDAELLSVLQTLRAMVNKPITITSGCRCRKHNRDVGGRLFSQHLLGKAADIVVNDYEPEEVYRILNDVYTNTFGIGNSEDFTHIDVRTKKKRW